MPYLWFPELDPVLVLCNVMRLVPIHGADLWAPSACPLLLIPIRLLLVDTLRMQRALKILARKQQQKIPVLLHFCLASVVPNVLSRLPF